MLSAEDLLALWLTVKVASLATLIMLLLGSPLAWWLAHTRSRWQGVCNALVAMPLVLPPTVLGFYLLMLMSPKGPVGQLTTALGLNQLSFTFSGLVVASVIYSLPFVVQPLQVSFSAVGRYHLEAAAMLGANPVNAFFRIALPMARSGILTAAILGFAHTVGEFGVVLMIGGNIPGQTRVASVQIYNHVEAMEYGQAHWLAFYLLLFSFIVLVILYSVIKTQPSVQTFK